MQCTYGAKLIRAGLDVTMILASATGSESALHPSPRLNADEFKERPAVCQGDGRSGLNPRDATSIAPLLPTADGRNCDKCNVEHEAHRHKQQ